MVQVHKVTESNLNRVKEFVTHLFSHDTLKDEPPVIAERLIINFLENNSRELVLFFKSPEFFPNLDPDKVLELIYNELYDRVYAASFPPVNRFLDNCNLSFFDILSETGVVDDMHRRKKIHDLILTLFKDRDVRYWMYPVLSIFRNNAVDRYIAEVFNRRDYIYTEIVNIEKIKPDAGTYSSLIKVILLLRTIVYLKGNKKSEGDSVSVTALVKTADNENFKNFTDEIIKSVLSMLPGIPSGIIRLAVKSYLRSDQLDKFDGLSKFVYILCSMFQYYRETDNPYIGSETPEKSWLGIAKQNFVYSGYDRGMVSSLYKIAEDHKW